MNGIRLECSRSGEVIAFDGYYGDWDEWQTCRGGFTGAKIKLEGKSVSF